MLKDKKKIIGIVLLAAIALSSVFIIAPKAQDPETAINSMAIRHLDEKETTVLKLTATAAGASVAIAAVPGDATTPIGEKFADLSSYFMIIMCAIFIEKYLVTITGMLAFRFIVPAACILGIFALASSKDGAKRFAKKLGVFALALYLLIPSSVMVAGLIDDTYDAVIADNIASTEEAIEEMPDTEQEAEEQGFLDTIKSWGSSVVDKVTTKASELIDDFTESLKKMMEAIAIMLITTCGIPILVIICFNWIVKALFSFDIGAKAKTALPKRNRKQIEQADGETGN